MGIVSIRCARSFKTLSIFLHLGQGEYYSTRTVFKTRKNSDSSRIIEATEMVCSSYQLLTFVLNQFQTAAIMGLVSAGYF